MNPMEAAGMRATLYVSGAQEAVYRGKLLCHPKGMFFEIDGWNGTGYFLPGTCARVWFDMGKHVVLE